MSADGWTRRDALRSAGLAGAGLSVSGLLAACGSDEGGSGGTATAVAASGAVIAPISDADVAQVRWVTGEGPGQLDLIKPHARATWLSLGPAMQGLLAFDVNGDLVPSLAESWRQVDPTTYVYTLRKDATFWNGDPLTPEDVVFSIDRARADEAQTSFYWGSVKSVTATGPNEVTIKLSQPDVFFRTIPAHFAGYIVQKKYAEQAGDSFGSPEAPMMGTGPYRVENLSPDTGLTLVRSESYWGDLPPVREISFDAIQDDDARLLAGQSGSLDGTFEVGIRQSQRWASDGDYGVEYTNNGWWAWMALNTAVKPFDDVHVRRALSHCLDRQGLIDSLLLGKGQPAPTIPPPEQWAGLLDVDEVLQRYAELPTFAYDPEKARAELAQSAYPDGFSTTIRTSTQYTRITAAAQALAETARPLGIDITVKEMPEEPWKAFALANDGLEMTAGIFLPDFPDPANNAYYILRSEFAAPDNFNWANYRNKDVDRALDDYLLTTDRQKRIDLLFKALEQTASDVPWIPMWFEQQAVTLRKDLAFEELGAWYGFRPWATYLGERAA